MPNWVCAGFNVTGDLTELRRFASMMIKSSAKVGGVALHDIPSPAKGDGPEPDTPEGRKLTLDFNGILPMPPESECHDWEAWAVDHWGVKWNAQEVDVRIEPDRIWFQFITPWDFPTLVFDALATEFPGLILSGSAYEESGEFELVGEFNGKNDWGPGEIDWIGSDDDNDREGAAA